MSKKNDWRVYRLYTMILQSKIDKKNDWRIVYSLIYNNLQSKIEWKMSKKNESNFDWRVVYKTI